LPDELNDENATPPPEAFGALAGAVLGTAIAVAVLVLLGRTVIEVAKAVTLSVPLIVLAAALIFWDANDLGGVLIVVISLSIPGALLGLVVGGVARIVVRPLARRFAVPDLAAKLKTSQRSRGVVIVTAAAIAVVTPLAAFALTRTNEHRSFSIER